MKMGKMSKIEKKTRTETYLQSKIIIFMILTLTLIPLVSAEDFGLMGDFEFDNYKQFNDSKDISDYGKIEIWDKGFFASDTMLSKTVLEYNTDLCILNCEARGTTTLYYNLPLMDNLKIYDIGGDGEWKETSIQTQNLQIKTGDLVEQVPNFYMDCSGEVGKGDVTCERVENGTKEITTPIYEDYDGSKLDAGVYEWRILGKKGMRESVDWRVEILGYETVEWATWNSSFETDLQDYLNFSSNENLINASRNMTSNDGQITFNDTAISGQGGWFSHAPPERSMNMSNTNDATSMNIDKNFTVSVWIQPVTNDAGMVWSKGCCGGGGASGMYRDASQFIHSPDGVTGTTIPVNVWTHILFIHNDSGQQIYRNGNLDGYSANGIPQRTGSFSLGEGTSISLPNNWNGFMDEFAYWNRSLGHLEAIDMYNGGAGIFFTPEPDYTNSTTVTLNRPTPSQNFSTSFVTFNCSAEGTGQPIGSDSVNITLIVDDLVNLTVTNSTSSQNITLQTNLSVSEGVHNWTCASSIFSGNQSTATARTFALDTTAPQVNITTPNGTLGLGSIGQNLSVVWQLAESNPDTCLLQYEGTNITMTCSDLNSSLIYNTEKQLIFFVNDTAGRQISVTSNWDFSMVINDVTYANTTTEGAVELFTVNATLGSGLLLSTATLVYNNTNFAGTFTNPTGNDYAISRSLVIPSVQALTNQTFYWNLVLANGSEFNTTQANQSVLNINLDGCTSNTIEILNLSLEDEELQTQIINGTIDIDIDLFSLGGTESIVNFSNNYTKVSSQTVCLPVEVINSTSYRMDALFRYTGTGYVIEYYNIQNFTLSNTTIGRNITLFPLNTSDSQEFVINFKDSNFLKVSDALIDISRNYVGEGVFKTVEIPKTDGDGNALGHLVLGDVIYTLTVSKNGRVLGVFENQKAVCSDQTIGDCRINLNAVSTSQDIQTLEQSQDLSYSISFDASTRTVSSGFSIPSGVPSSMILNVTKIDRFGNTTVCSSPLTSSSGTLSCSVGSSFGNLTVSAILIKDGTVVIRRSFWVGDSAFSANDYTGILLLLFLYILLVFMMMGSEIMAILGGIMGLAIGSILNLYVGGGLLGLGGTIVWFIIAGAIIIYKINKLRGAQG